MRYLLLQSPVEVTQGRSPRLDCHECLRRRNYLLLKVFHSSLRLQATLQTARSGERAGHPPGAIRGQVKKDRLLEEEQKRIPTTWPSRLHAPR